MLMKTLKLVNDTRTPDEVEMPTKFKVGDRIALKYDWCEKTNGILGSHKTWHQDVTSVEVVDIKCNMLVVPAEVRIFMKTIDPIFYGRCRCDEFDAPEEQVLERVVRLVRMEERGSRVLSSEKEDVEIKGIHMPGKKVASMTHTEVVPYVVEKVKTDRDFYVNISDLHRKARLHVYIHRIVDVDWYDVKAEVFDGKDYVEKFGLSANSVADLAVIVRKAGWWLSDMYSYDKVFRQFLPGCVPCCLAIEKAVLDEPVVFGSFTVYFDREILENVRDKFGVDLYKECRKAVCEKYGFTEEL